MKKLLLVLVLMALALCGCQSKEESVAENVSGEESSGYNYDENIECTFIVRCSLGAEIYIYLDENRNVIAISSANEEADKIIDNINVITEGPVNHTLKSFVSACNDAGYLKNTDELKADLIVYNGEDTLFCTPVIEQIKNFAESIKTEGNYNFNINVINSIDTIETAGGSRDDVIFNKTRYTDGNYSTILDLDYQTEAPKLTIEGDRWPFSEEELLAAWEEAYPIMEQILGPACDDIFENGLVWICNDESMARGFSEQFPERNAIELYILDDELNDGKQFVNDLHETGHIWVQSGNTSVKFDHGQWIWEAATGFVEKVLVHEGLLTGQMSSFMDLYEYLGYDALNGVVTESDKANRSLYGSGHDQFYYMTSVLSTPGTYDYFVKVFKARQEYADENNVEIISDEVISKILDEAADGRTIDGMKPSEWLFSRNVANINGKDGTYLSVVGNYNDNPGDDLRVTAYAFTRKSLKETALDNQEITISEYNANGDLLGTGTFNTNDTGIVDKVSVANSNESVPDGFAAIKIEASMNVDGTEYKDINYTILVPESEKMQMADNRMFLIINDENEDLVNDLTLDDINVTGAKIVHEESLKEGLLVLEAEDCAEVHINIGSSSYVLSKPACARVSVITR